METRKYAKVSAITIENYSSVSLVPRTFRGKSVDWSGGVTLKTDDGSLDDHVTYDEVSRQLAINNGQNIELIYAPAREYVITRDNTSSVSGQLPKGKFNTNLDELVSHAPVNPSSTWTGKAQEIGVNALTSGAIGTIAYTLAAATKVKDLGELVGIPTQEFPQYCALIGAGVTAQLMKRPVMFNIAMLTAICFSDVLTGNPIDPSTNEIGKFATYLGAFGLGQGVKQKLSPGDQF